MSSPVEFLRGLLARHFEELEFLLSQRTHALGSSAFRLANLRELEERIDAHLDGLILGADETPALLQEAIGGDEPGPVAAAALTLLWLEKPAAAKLVIEALTSAEGPKSQAIGWALSHAPIESISEQLQSLVHNGSPAAAAGAALGLAFHKQLKAGEPRLAELSTDLDPLVRAATWRVAALL
jgi:hypothetical protein